MKHYIIFLWLLLFSPMLNAIELFDGELVFEGGIGHKLGGAYTLQGDNPMGVMRIRWERDNDIWWKPDVVEYSHESHLFQGFPFDDRTEEWYDGVHILWRWK